MCVGSYLFPNMGFGLQKKICCEELCKSRRLLSPYRIAVNALFVSSHVNKQLGARLETRSIDGLLSMQLQAIIPSYCLHLPNLVEAGYEELAGGVAPIRNSEIF